MGEVSPSPLLAPALMLALVPACSSSNSGMGDSIAADGGVAGGGDATVIDDPQLDAALPGIDASVQALQAPQLTPCPDGWREVDKGGFTVCDAWPDTGIESCAGATQHLPGTSNCQPIGTSCPASGWATNLPSDVPVLYVDPTSTGPQNGSQADPYRSISAALTAANGGEIIALVAGDYFESLRVRDDVEIWGACVDGTRLVSNTIYQTVLDRETIVSVESGNVRFHNLSVTGGFPAFEMTPFSGLELDSVYVERAVIAVELAQQAQLTTNEVIFQQMIRVLPDDPRCADINVRCLGVYGASVSSEGTLDLEATATLRRTTSAASAPIQLQDAADTTSTTALVMDEFVGRGSISNASGPVEATRSDFKALQAGQLTLRDSIVGTLIVGRSSDIERVSVHDARLLGSPGDPGHNVRDVVVSDIANRSPTITGKPTRHVLVTNEAQIQRLAIVDGEGIGLRVEDQASVSAEDVHVVRVASVSNELPVALGLYHGASMTVERFSVSNSELVGVQLMDQAQVHLRDGDIAECTIGANVQIPDYDLSTLQDLVRYSGNQVDIDALDLAPPPPVPEWLCGDGIDNDNDNDFDCDDEDCGGFSGCAL